MSRLRHAALRAVWVAVAAIGFVVILSSTPLSYYYGLPLLETASPQKSDVIVLLSSGQLDARWLSPDATQRTAGALWLYRSGYAPVIISSGSQLALGRDQAGVQADWLRIAGVPPQAILVERRSTRTYESVLEVLRIMRERGFQSAVVVTSEMDVPRARLAFRKAGMERISFLAVPEFKHIRHTFDIRWGFPFVLHATYEYAALCFYRLEGWI